VTYAISKTYRFSAAHHLPQLAEGHKCRRVHGHNYAVTLTLEAEDLDHFGMVLDYGDLDPVAQWIRTTLDHRDLNGELPVPPGKMTVPPTAEYLARVIFEVWAGRFPQLAQVTVSETPETTASYRP
jgi:6-pyruvoyltetrahydropterin/6-carboxytetrahydropterin synthase